MSYLMDEDYQRIRSFMKRSEARPLIADKMKFQEHFGRISGIRLPRYLGYTENGLFRDSEGGEHAIRTDVELGMLLTRLLDRVHANGGTSIFAKPVGGTSGRGMFKFSSAEFSPELAGALREGYVLQQTVEQHPALATVMPDTLNTLRVTTLRRGREEPELASTWIRFGRSGSVVDNASSGGVFNGVDLVTGRLLGPCMTKFEQGAKLYTHHPDTGHPLVGFEVPEFHAVCEMALTAARHIEHPIVGWDVGLSVEGPVVIEGNSTPNYYSDEIANGTGYLGHPVLGQYIRGVLG